MQGALWIAAFLAAVGIMLYVGELIWRRRHPSATTDSTPMAEDDVRFAEDGLETSAGKNAEDSSSGECCGLHLVCEKDSLSPMSQEIIYYDDEELDRFRCTASDNYSDEDADMFADVLYTMRSDEVAGWCRSLHLRGVELPDQLKDEVTMMISEAATAAQP